ncbi:hypothetical protein K438DRAFT_1758812 [Mycena galopus ATCC 62051]|nr:hypothetical protein K438DRAFT_1758812 [Mycena galopus ATCC 62051]
MDGHCDRKHGRIGVEGRRRFCKHPKSLVDDQSRKRAEKPKRKRAGDKWNGKRVSRHLEAIQTASEVLQGVASGRGSKEVSNTADQPTTWHITDFIQCRRSVGPQMLAEPQLSRTPPKPAVHKRLGSALTGDGSGAIKSRAKLAVAEPRQHYQRLIRKAVFINLETGPNERKEEKKHSPISSFGYQSILFTVPLLPGTIYTTVTLSTSHTHTIRTTVCSNEDAVHAAALGESGRPPAARKTSVRTDLGKSRKSGAGVSRSVSALKKIIAHALEKKAGEEREETQPDLKPFSPPSPMRNATLSAPMTTSSAIVRSMLQRPRHENPAHALARRHRCHRRVVVRDGVDVRRNNERPRSSMIVKGSRSSAARRPQFLLGACVAVRIDPVCCLGQKEEERAIRLSGSAS